MKKIFIFIFFINFIFAKNIIFFKNISQYNSMLNICSNYYITILHNLKEHFHKSIKINTSILEKYNYKNKLSDGLIKIIKTEISYNKNDFRYKSFLNYYINTFNNDLKFYLNDILFKDKRILKNFKIFLNKKTFFDLDKKPFKIIQIYKDNNTNNFCNNYLKYIILGCYNPLNTAFINNNYYLNLIVFTKNINYSYFFNKKICNFIYNFSIKDNYEKSKKLINKYKNFIN